MILHSFQGSIRGTIIRIMKTSLFPLRTEVLKVNSQEKQRSLQTGRHNEYSPRTPALLPQPRCQTTRKDQAPGCLDTHHGYAQAADAADPESGVDLREILDGGEDRCEDTEEVGPCLKRLGAFDRKGDGYNEHD